MRYESDYKVNALQASSDRNIYVNYEVKNLAPRRLIGIGMINIKNAKTKSININLGWSIKQ